MAKQVSTLILSGTISAGTTDIVSAPVNVSGYREVRLEIYSPVAVTGTGYIYGTSVSEADALPNGRADIPYDGAKKRIDIGTSVPSNNTIYSSDIYSVQLEWVWAFFQLQFPIGQNAPVYIVLTARS